MKRLIICMALCILGFPARAHEWNPNNEWDWASKAMREDHGSVKNSPRYRPYRASRRHAVRPHAHDESHEERMKRLASLEHRRRHHHGPAVHGFVLRDQEVGRKCLERVNFSGDQALTDEGARQAADKAWSQEVRYREGERYADVGNAVDRQYECVRSGIGYAPFNRCRLFARPCAPERMEAR
jgi:hypothetical protein